VTHSSRTKINYLNETDYGTSVYLTCQNHAMTMILLNSIPAAAFLPDSIPQNVSVPAGRFHTRSYIAVLRVFLIVENVSTATANGILS
jgi:hypothetical protein